MGTITRGLANSITTGGKVVSTSLSGTVQASNVNNESLDSVTAFDSSLGDFVESTASDVSAGPTTKGQLFYNTTDGVLKGVRLGEAAWASGTNLPASKFNMASGGTNTAGIIAGGELGPGTRTGETIYFDGSTWSNQSQNVSPAPDADGVKMAGTQTASILASFRGGGTPSDPAYKDAAEWDGSSWTSIPSTSDRHSFSNFLRSGSPSGATITGGANEVGGYESAVEEYNGTSWGSETAMPAGRGNMAAFGTPTAGVVAGGQLGPGAPNTTATALEYDGSSWTSTGSMTAAARTTAAAGTQTNGVTFGGYTPAPAATGITNTYDGTTFTSAPSMTTARGGLGSTGNAANAYAIGGNPPVVATVEEFTEEQPEVKTLTTA